MQFIIVCWEPPTRLHFRTFIQSSSCDGQEPVSAGMLITTYQYIPGNPYDTLPLSPR